MEETPSQLELFEENDQISLLKREVLKLRQRCELLRRGMSKKYNQLAKLCMILQEENSLLKRRLDAIEKTDSAADGLEDIEGDDYLLKLFEEAYRT